MKNTKKSVKVGSAGFNLRIHGKEFSVNFVPVIAGAPAGAVGYNNCAQQEIHVVTEQHKEGMRDTMLHEIIHVLDYDAQLGLKERQVHCLASSIFSVLKDNKEFTKWLLS